MIGHWFRRWRHGESTAPTSQAAPSEAKAGGKVVASPDDLANTAIEQLVEDEALRGDLTDDGYQPLQDWATARLQRIAHEAVHHPDPRAAMDGFTQQIRAFVRAAVQAAQDGALGDVPEQVKPRVVLEKDVPAVLDALRTITFTSDANANANAVAAALATATSKENRA